MALLFGTITAQAQVTGRVFRDFNANGIQDTPISSTAVSAGEPGVKGVLVTAYPATGSPVSVTTDISGVYLFPNAGGTAAGTQLRLEFSNLPTNYASGPMLTSTGGSGTTEQFVTAGTSTTANYGINYPLDYCQSNPLLATPCYVNGNPSGGGTGGSKDALVGFDFNSAGDAMGILAANGIAAPVDPVNYKIAASTVGSTWGMAWDRKTKKLYTSAFVKRHVGIGPLGEGGIYVLNHSAAGTPVVSQFVDLNLIGINTGTVGIGTTPALRNTQRGLTASATVADGGDPQSFSAIGKVGLGDLDISDDGKVLWVVNLFDKTLNSILIDSDNNPATAPTSADVRTYAIPNPCGTGSQRPFALKYYQGNVYVGVVCEAALEATIYQFDGAAFTPVLINGSSTIALNYTRTGGTINCPTVSTNWHVWTDVPPAVVCSGGPTTTSVLYHYPVPMLSDIEFDVDGSMILTFMDRMGHQIGAQNTQLDGSGLENYHGAGDILRVCNVGGAFAMQGTPGCPNKLSNGQGPNGGEYYFRDEFNENAGSSYVNGTRGVIHSETTTGGIAVLPGSGESAVAVFDPWGTFYVSGGINFFNNATGGSRNLNYMLFLGDGTAGFQPGGTFGKANGLGDVEVLCNPAPIEIGNRVWLDKNKNGIQDSNEPPVAGVTVQLFAAGGSTPLSTTVTDANGLYVFKSASTTALTYNTAYEVRIPAVQTALTSLSFTTANAGANEGIDSDFTPGVTAAVTSLTTGDLGQNAHTFDAGLICNPPVLAISPSQTICQGSLFALPLSASVTSGTATGQQWYLTNATGTSFTAISGATSLTFTPTTQLPTAGTTRYFALTAYNSTSICAETAFVSLTSKALPTITFTVPSAAAVTQCANTTMNLTVSTTAKAPDAIKFVYFTSPLASAADAYTATGGTVLGTIASGTLVTNTVALANVQLPDNVGQTAQTLYVYALLQSGDGLCLPSDQFTLTLTPRPKVTIGGDAILCQGTTTQLTALGVSGGTYQWYWNGGTTPISTANPYNTTAINTTTTYQVRATLASCVSDLVSYTLTPVVCTSCAGGTATIGGQVYQDFKSEGAKQINDLGVAGVTVTIFQCDATGQSTQVAQMTTDLNGAYSFTGLTAGVDYRIEFTNLPDGTQPTFRGSQNGTTVQFSKPGSCSISLGINYPADFCQTTPKVVIPCYENGTGTGSTAAGFVSFDYSATTKRVDGTIGEIGSVWGVAYQRTTRKAFTAAFLKRHVGFAAQGPGGVYVYDYNNPAVDPPLVASFSLQNVVAANGGPAIDLGTVTRVTSPATDPNYISTVNTTPNYDIDAFAKVGKMSFGDADMDETNNRLWLVNLYQRAIISVNVSGTATALNGASAATLSPLTNQYLLDNLPGVPNCGTDGVFRPWALAFHRGKGYLGGVCSSETSKDPSKLVSYVLEFDPNNVGAGFTTVMTVPMNYPREQLEGINPTLTYRVNASWRAWINAYADIPGAPASPGRLGWPQPILSDIAFADNGDMVMGFTDRLSHQWGMGNYLPVAGTTILTEMGAGGDILHACFVNGKWLLEGTAGSCKTNDILNNSGYSLANDGPSKTGEFYANDQYNDGTNTHFETTNGALVIQPGKNEVITTAFDINGLFQQGVRYFSTTTGANATGSFAIVPNGNGTFSFGKGNGLGDLEILCDLAPIQIGNRVWRDDNRNGIQDPCEPPIPGAVVTLYNAAKTTAIASATTNAAGEYYFSSLTLTAGTSTSAVATTALQYNTTYGLVITSLGTSTVVTSQGLALTDVSPLTPGESGTLNSGLSTINNDALVDGGKPCIKLTTGGPGDNNHTYDFGLVKFVCSLTATAQASSQTVCTGLPVTLTAQVTPGGSYTYAWSAPAGVTLTGANTATATATASTAGLQTFTVTVSSSPSCFTTATVSVSAVDCTTYLTIAILDPGTCFSATNGYTTTGIISLTNAIAGTATITDGSVTTSVIVSAGATTVPYSLTGLSSGTGVHTITVSYAGQTASTTYTAPASCTTAPQLASLGDYLWLDTNRNGQQDVGETGVPGVTVKLFDPTSSTTTPVASLTTDSNGKYLFINLTPGVYCVIFDKTTLPTGYTFTSANTTPDATDSDANPVTGKTTNYTLAAGDQNLTVDAGILPLTASLGDYVWLDTNKNGVQDPTETGVTNVTAVLCDAISGTVISTTLTDGAGLYLFTNLNPGTYVVKFTAPTGTTFTTPNTGPDATDSDVVSTTSTTGATGVYSLTAGEQNLTVDAGLIPLLGSIGDFVWNDLNKNGQQDVGEPGVGGVTVRLLQETTPGTFTVVSTTVTAGNGIYLFSNLSAGTYLVEFATATLPVNYVLTTANAVSVPTGLDSDANPATGRSGLITLVPANPALRDILTIDAGIVSTDCVTPSVCVPIVIKWIVR
ncbi:SdrD B-like domain-containing protein [Spirosoma aerophilum]